MYAERVVNNNCFQKLLYREMSTSKRGELLNSIVDILMKNVSELRKILQDGVARGEFNKDIDMDMVIATIYGTKNFLINAPQLSTRLLGFDVQNDDSIEETLKPRIKTYFKTLLKGYLVIDHHAK
jgi:TetR/AcrR family transcriptional regulator